jgi:hypothetical protein
MSTAPLGAVIPATVMAVPASESAGRGWVLTVRARRIRPINVRSMPTRSHQRIRAAREGRATHWMLCLGARAEELHTTTVRRRDRRLTAASRTSV